MKKRFLGFFVVGVAIIVILVVWYFFLPRLIVFRVSPEDARVFVTDEVVTGKSVVWVNKGVHELKITKDNYMPVDLRVDTTNAPFRIIDLDLTKLSYVTSIEEISLEDRFSNQNQRFIYSDVNKDYLAIFDQRSKVLALRALDKQVDRQVSLEAEFTEIRDFGISEDGKYAVVTTMSDEKLEIITFDNDTGLEIFKTSSAQYGAFNGSDLILIDDNSLFKVKNGSKSKEFISRLPENFSSSDCSVSMDGFENGFLTCLEDDFKYYRFSLDGFFEKLSFNLPVASVNALAENRFILTTSDPDRIEAYLLDHDNLEKIDITLESRTILPIDQNRFVTIKYNERNLDFHLYSLETKSGTLINSIADIDEPSSFGFYKESVYIEVNGTVYNFNIK